MSVTRIITLGAALLLTATPFVLPTPGGPCGTNPIFEIKKSPTDGLYHIYCQPRECVAGCNPTPVPTR